MNLGLKRGTVRLCEYDPAWITEYEKEAHRLKQILPQDVGPFEHIGSTAIPRIPAKPIIDLMAGVKDFSNALKLESLLEDAGYTHRHNGDTADRMLFVLGSEDCRTHHFSLVIIGSSQWVNALAFRDALRSDVLLTAQYAKLKRELEEKYSDNRASYTKEKEPFFRRVFEKYGVGKYAS